MHIGMLLPFYDKKTVLNWQRLIFAQTQSCNIERTEAIVYFDRSPGMIGMHEEILSCCSYVVSKKLITPALIFLLLSKPTLTVFACFARSIVVNTIQYRTASFMIADRFSRSNTRTRSGYTHYLLHTVKLPRRQFRHHSASAKLASK
jgi:hypothetical protein